MPFKNWYVGIVLSNAVPNIFDHQDSLWQRQCLNIFAQRCYVQNISKKTARVKLPAARVSAEPTGKAGSRGASLLASRERRCRNATHVGG
ncbi:MAG: hypothetical protein Q7J98_06260, partial [Kiritimatiellia bacterium]|nr:hypothetical protein [Kiritimatiellia bacterium]